MKNLYVKIGQAVLILLILLAFGSTNAANTFSGNSIQNAVISPENPLPFAPTAYDIDGVGGYYCEGGAGLPVGVKNSETGVNYTLYMDDISTGQTVAGNDGSPITFGNQLVPDFDVLHSFTVKGQNASGTTLMNGNVNIVHYHNFTDLVSVSADANPALEPGTNVTLTASATYLGDLTWEWYLNGTHVGDDYYKYPHSPATYTPSEGDQIYVKMSDNGACVTNSPLSSNPVTMHVVDHIWTGTNNFSWNNVDNWNPSTTPASDADVYIPNNASHSLYINNNNPAAPITCHNLYVRNTNYFTIASNGYLTVTGTLTLDGTDGLFIESTNTNTGSLIEGALGGTGTANVQRALQADVWHFISSPISDATANVFVGDYLRTSDPTSTDGWGSYIIPTTTPLEVMRGYACYKPASKSLSEVFDGHLNTGIQTFTGNRNDSDPWAGWHLVGNPYPSSINLAVSSIGISWGSFEHTAYFWDEGSIITNPDYPTGNYDVYPGFSPFGTHTAYCPPGQGFFVHIVDSYTGATTLTFKPPCRVHSSEAFLKDAPAIKNALLMTARGSNNTYSDKCTVHFNPDATSGYDPGYDAYKLFGLREAPQLYTAIGNINVTCNSLPFESRNTAIQMGFSCGLPGIYTLKADSLSTFSTSIGVSLEDVKLGFTQDLKVAPVYSFTYDTLDNPNRFILHFTNTTYGISDSKNIEPLKIYSSGNSIYVKSLDGTVQSGSVTVYDMLGKVLYTGTVLKQLLNQFTPNIGEGYYQVRVVTSYGVYNAKVYLSN